MLRALKSSDVTRTIPVVMLTSSSAPKDRRAAYGLGAHSYVVKPLAHDEFLDTVARMTRYWTTVNMSTGPR